MIKATALEQVVRLLGEMPGIGSKTAQRLAYYVLSRETAYAHQLGDALRELKDSLQWCRTCYNISAAEMCEICRQDERDHRLICVVEDAANLANIERSGGFKGYYHVLQGVLSPVNGIGPDDLRIQELLARLEDDQVTEIILATNPTVEGEATAMYLSDILADREVSVSRIGVGVPIGGSLDYCDEITMAKAFENRRRLH
ncbi:recombination mediator RecR [Sulfidibacter corallicola]|uniref:Recombination protein RecR n=1 Tax=Sulfidibacter corallicola TaxID=2818388 RepID=A0A8A4TV35_SULCO|nr:recombination mediator RecR [Sulfidibacter corallicola]QTD52984.1 recombination protein RecR [Sulfidibacter corallicola]